MEKVAHLREDCRRLRNLLTGADDWKRSKTEDEHVLIIGTRGYVDGFREITVYH